MRGAQLSIYLSIHLSLPGVRRPRRVPATRLRLADNEGGPGARHMHMHMHVHMHSTIAAPLHASRTHPARTMHAPCTMHHAHDMHIHASCTCTSMHHAHAHAPTMHQTMHAPYHPCTRHAWARRTTRAGPPSGSGSLLRRGAASRSRAGCTYRNAAAPPRPPRCRHPPRRRRPPRRARRARAARRRRLAVY